MTASLRCSQISPDPLNRNYEWHHGAATGPPESSVTREEMLDNTKLNWLTNTGASSLAGLGTTSRAAEAQAGTSPLRPRSRTHTLVVRRRVRLPNR